MHPAQLAQLYISIHALLAESDAAVCPACGREPISIHALLAESDFDRMLDERRARGFLSTLSLRRATECASLLSQPGAISIHALLAESDTVIAKPLR